MVPMPELEAPAPFRAIPPENDRPPAPASRGPVEFETARGKLT